MALDIPRVGNKETTTETTVFISSTGNCPGTPPKENQMSQIELVSPNDGSPDYLDYLESNSVSQRKHLLPSRRSAKSLRRKAAQMISNVCCFFFLSFLMFLSVIRYIYIYHIKLDRLRHPPATPKQKAYPIDYKYLSKTTNLSYYCELLNLKLLEYRVITKDGFILSLYRLVDLRQADSSSPKKPVLFLHGLLQSCGAFVTSGEKSIAYMLVENGYDVWLANNRCGFEPRHLHYTPDDPEMWDWDLTDMARYDLTCFIDEILKVTRFDGPISLIGHSQGTAQITLLVSKELEIGYNDKVDNVVLLAPAIYGGTLLSDKLFIRFIKSLPNPIYNVFFGVTSFMPIMLSLKSIIVKTPIFGFCSYCMFSFLFDWNDRLWDPSIRSIQFLFSPVYVSAKLMKWWLSNKSGQGLETGKPILTGKGGWFNEDCPSMMLVIGGEDRLVDGDLFADKLSKDELMKDRFSYVKIDEYAHLDVLWADDVLDRFGDQILTFLKG